jgi:hypothetical protein
VAQPVADIVKDGLRQAHQVSQIGRVMESPGDEPAVLPPGTSQEEILAFLLVEVQTLEALVVRLAREIDVMRES